MADSAISAASASAVAAAGQASASLNVLPGAADSDFGPAIVRLNNWIDGAVRLLPNIAVAVVVLLIFWGLALLARRLINRSSVRRNRDNLGEVLGGFVKWTVLLLGFLLAATIVIPSLKPGDLIAGLGVSSVAIGFAFKDILQNWLAGLLILPAAAVRGERPDRGERLRRHGAPHRDPRDHHRDLRWPARGDPEQRHLHECDRGAHRA